MTDRPFGLTGVLLEWHKRHKEKGLEPIPKPDEKPWWWKKTITKRHGSFKAATQKEFEKAYYDHHGVITKGYYGTQAEAKKRFQSGVDRPSPGHPALQEFEKENPRSHQKGGVVKRKPRTVRKLRKGGALLFGMKK